MHLQDLVTPDLINLSPIAQILLIGALLAAAALWPLLRRHRGSTPGAKLRAITLVTLFLTFDLVLFGAFTRLTDSGLGCPDWPGCYGSASPSGAHGDISQAQAALPSGPVTHSKAWIEMVHRYLATGVGALITTTLVWSSWLAWRRRAGPAARAGGAADPTVSPGWAALTFLWVCAQGAFGALTVTLKLYPAIVTLHLLGGLGLLALLVVQAQRHHAETLPLRPLQRHAAWALWALVIAQVTLGGWVSTNYAVLACTDFPTCHGSWWPSGATADYASGFTVLRELGRHADGSWLSLAALVAIHWVHRVGAALVFVALAGLCALLWRHPHAAVRRHAQGLAALALWQFATGLSNVVLGWPLVAAVAHTGGAAALLALLTSLLTRAAPRRHTLPSIRSAPSNPNVSHRAAA